MGKLSSLKEKMAAKRAGKTVEKETSNKKVKKEEKVVGRGRPKGMISVVNEKHKNEINSFFKNCENIFEGISENIEKFTENGNKKAAKEVRKQIMDISKIFKEMRKKIQEAKVNMKKEKKAA